MHDCRNLSHTRWDCKYHIVIVPKYRQKKLYGKFRRQVGEILKELCRQKGVELLEGHLMPDHIHMRLSVPPKFSIAFIIGFLKGKSVVFIHCKVLKTQRLLGFYFWPRGYCVSTVGLDEATIRKYIREQEKHDKQLEFDFQQRSLSPVGAFPK
ncbi:IS200/IS605 family transposase [Desulfoluna butyratoxydans]|uniref:IS200/IS605 family transposase n=1 Tax=Desulfoluna butyratoxydans TaxID=231438 RepID=UPI0015D2EC37|nr:IS200/IS605 family transposase [Desulfoluna butyratoxydans]